MKKTKYFGIAMLCIFLLLVISLSISSIAANIIGNNYRNVTVQTRVNITNSKPVVTSLVIYQETNLSLRNITLNAGSTRIVTCNATIRDYNGFSDVTGVNATLYHSTNLSTDPDDNNTHYTNTTCVAGSGSGYFVDYACTFDVYYYALNGTWSCNVTAKDSYNKTGSSVNTTTFYPVYALNVTEGIDFGNVSVEEYSENKTADITNFGNMAINISVEGYGVTRGDGLAMNCTNGNISVSNLKFSNADVDWASKIALSQTPQAVPGVTIPKQTIPNTLMTNTTYWQLYIPPNPGGNCTGHVIFQAEAP